MDVILLHVVPVVVTAVMLFAALAIAIIVGNASGAVIRKIFGVGGK